MRYDNRSVKEKIEDFKKRFPTALRIYLFYIVRDNGAKMYLDDITVFETSSNQDNIIKHVSDVFNCFLERVAIYKPEEVHCERYSLINGFCEEYLLLNNGAYERSGIYRQMHDSYSSN